MIADHYDLQLGMADFVSELEQVSPSRAEHRKARDRLLE
jgi:hypothetical protein